MGACRSVSARCSAIRRFRPGNAGKAKPRLYRYRNCNHLGCFGVVPVDRAMADSLSKAADGSIYFRLGNSKTVKVSVPLKGFPAAFKGLDGNVRRRRPGRTQRAGPVSRLLLSRSLLATFLSAAVLAVAMPVRAQSPMDNAIRKADEINRHLTTQAREREERAARDLNRPPAFAPSGTPVQPSLAAGGNCAKVDPDPRGRRKPRFLDRRAMAGPLPDARRS